MASAFKIDRDIPVPADIGRGRRCLYPFQDMRVGDSFVAEGLSAVRAAHAWGSRHKATFASRQLERGSNQFRIWRLA